MKKIAVITRDCAGVNAALRSVVRSASAKGVEVLGVMRGYDGLIDADLMSLDRRAVSGIINRGGTILKTSRSLRFKSANWQKQAVMTIRDQRIDGLIVIGGNGSLTGAHILASRYSIPVVGIPATIDNDVNGVTMTIGADTAINVALDALDKIRDTATSLERIFVVEVMGRNCGYIALRVALAAGCEDVIIPERKFNLKKISENIVEGNIRGKRSWITIVAEGKAKASKVDSEITRLTGLETRIVVLGHVQRGGSPTAFDRILAARYGHFAVSVLLKGKTDCCVALRNDQLTTVSLAKAIQKKDIEASEYYRLIQILT
ncbi:MAG: 6-phosphofructokinase [Candidatus Omnitrophica bacterium]|nr:6-phosphofructokinase [Candidatus Omnitrophota bacterium]